MKNITEFLENSIHLTPLTQFVYESKLTEDDTNQIKDKASYYADAYCLKLAALDFFEMINKNEDKSSVVDFMAKISKGVSSYNDNVPTSITKYAKSKTNVTDGDWRGWYTTIKGYVTRNDWSYDNQGEVYDFYDDILKDGGDTSWTVLNKTACENLYELFNKYLSDSKTCKAVIKHWKDSLKKVKTESSEEIKSLIKHLKDSKNPDYEFTPKVESLDEKIRKAEHEIWLGKLHFVQKSALIHICELLKRNEKSDVSKFILESLRTLENFNCELPEFLNISRKVYTELYEYDLFKIYDNLAKIVNNKPYDIGQLKSELGLSSYNSKWTDSTVNKFVDILNKMASNAEDWDKLIKEFKKELTDKNLSISWAKKAENKLKQLKAESEQGKIDVNDK